MVHMHVKEHSPNMGTKTLEVVCYLSGVSLAFRERTFPKHGDENTRKSSLPFPTIYLISERTFPKHGDENLAMKLLSRGLEGERTFPKHGDENFLPIIGPFNLPI